MDKWEVKYNYQGFQKGYVRADTMIRALEKFMADHPDVPGIAYYSIRCVTVVGKEKTSA